MLIVAQTPRLHKNFGANCSVFATSIQLLCVLPYNNVYLIEFRPNRKETKQYIDDYGECTKPRVAFACIWRSGVDFGIRLDKHRNAMSASEAWKWCRSRDECTALLLAELNTSCERGSLIILLEITSFEQKGNWWTTINTWVSISEPANCYKEQTPEYICEFSGTRVYRWVPGPCWGTWTGTVGTSCISQLLSASLIWYASMDK